MKYFNRLKNNSILIISIPVILLLLSVFIESSENDDALEILMNESNSSLQTLPNKYIELYENSISNDTTDIIYSNSFIETDTERKLILIKKNPTSREFLGQFIVYLYPENDIYNNSPNYIAAKKCLDYSIKNKPILYNYNGDNYSVLEVNLPFIETNKLFIIQHGVWKTTAVKPFDTSLNLDENLNKTISSLSELYHPIFYDVLNNNDIIHLSAEQSINDFISTNNYKVVKLKNKNSFWKSISLKKESFNSSLLIYNDAENEITDLIKSYLNSDKEFDAVFDIHKLSKYFAYINLFSNNNSKEMGLMLNPKSHKLEPIYLNTNKLGELNTYLKGEKIDDSSFLNTYVNALEILKGVNYVYFFNQNQNFEKSIKLLNQRNPEVVFNYNVLFHNQLVIKKALNPSIVLKAEFLNYTKNTFSVTVENLSIFPIKILDLNFRKKKKIGSDVNTNLIFKNSKDTIHFELPRSFENLFVHKKSKTTGFVFEKNIFDLNIVYQIADLNKKHYTEIIPYQPTKNYNKTNDLFRQEQTIITTDYLTINNDSKKIDLIKDFTLTTPLIFPKGYTISAKPGITINIENGGKIISYSPLNLIGTKEKPISFISKDKEGQGLLILANGKLSKLKYVNFDWLTNPSHGMWSTSSAVTFYESPVNIDYVKISNNTCEDALNVVRSEFKLTNTYFINTQSDAFDGDYVTGIINSCVFKNLGNDAIDVSGSDLDISNVKIYAAGDKAFSAGENSQMKINKATVENCAIAIAGKDLSDVTINNLTIINTKLGFTAFQKKPEFGPSTITANNVKMEKVETSYLIENTSSLIIDDTKIETKQADVKSKMYGVEFGVSSKETKIRKKK